ncbi:MAG: endosialidase [Eubacterium sp.]|nr:endosialidase [Eubacterium sp.]MDD5995170.1 endosialidase [Clostridiales bacterium]MDY3773990.1 endosialidase [Eubacterium sp.]
MSVVEELIRKEDNGSLSFGNYLLDTKTKKADFEYQGDLYKVKTFKEITKLEKNGLFVYESVPGSAVTDFKNDGEEISFTVEAAGDLGFTLELEPSQEYKVLLEGVELGKMKTNLGGKLNVSIELDEGKKAAVKVIKC